MSAVELMYNEYLDALREATKEENFSFLDALISLTRAYDPPGLHLCVRSPEQIKRLEERLIDIYRVRYYEVIANKSLKGIHALTDAVVIDEREIRKAREARRHAMRMKEKQDENLKLGRQKGATKNKKRADAIKVWVSQMNGDLLMHPNTARWGVEKRAEYIAEKLATGTIEIDGDICSATMGNGKKYSSSTIITWITGT